MTDLTNLSLNWQICSSSVNLPMVRGVEFVHFFISTGTIYCRSKHTSPDPSFRTWVAVVAGS